MGLLGGFLAACSGSDQADGTSPPPMGAPAPQDQCLDTAGLAVPCLTETGAPNPEVVAVVPADPLAPADPAAVADPTASADPANPGDPEQPAADPVDNLPSVTDMPEPAIDAPEVTAEVVPFEPVQAASTVRKVKQLLVGLAPTDADVAVVTERGPAGLQELISTWLTDPTFQPLFRNKMIPYFRNTFQQTGFTPTEDFKLQLLENGGFDFGPFGERAVGGEVYFRLIKNLQDSFALTAWQLVAEGRPFSEVLTTRRFLMTTALKATYVQIEMPNDEPFNFGFRFGGEETERFSWWIDYSGNDIPLSESLDPSSPNYLVFDDEAPEDTGGFNVEFGRLGSCRGVAEAPNEECVVAGTSYRCPPSGGYAQLFQRLIGYTPRYPFSGNPDCGEHAAKPIMEVSDTEDWAWVELTPLGPGEPYVQPYDLPALRQATTLPLALPRVGFYTTPAFLALWNTNDSNQHRVTANQTLLAALNMTFTPADVLIPVDPIGLDAEHSVDGTDCYGCHKTLDPMRAFWSSYYDFNDRNDFPSQVFGGTANPRPSTVGGTFAILNVNEAGTTMDDLGAMLSRVVDVAVADDTVNRFALAMTQSLCFYANSVECSLVDPEFRRVARAFESSNFDFPTLVMELFSSPLVTGAAATATTDAAGMVVSIARRDHVCAALSHRLGVEDVCALSAPKPTSQQTATIDMAESIVADAFSRGSERPVTPAKPTLFYRAATEMVCEDVAARLVDVDGALYTTADVEGAIRDMAERIMGYPPSDAHHAAAIGILQQHYAEALENPPSGGGFQGGGFGQAPAAGQGASAETNALRSTFSLACQAPTSLAVGL